MLRNTLGVVLLLLVFQSCVFHEEKGVKIVAHRGYWKAVGSAQNSIAALEKAAQIGMYGAEFDVHLTADNMAVIFHDDIIDGIDIQATHYVDLKDKLLSNGERLPTLEQYLERAKSLDIQLILELKPHKTPERNREAARKVVEMIKDYGFERKTDYITFNLDAGLEFIRVSPGSQVAYLNGELSPRELKEKGFTGLDYHYSVMQKNPEWFAEAREEGITVNVWTVNEPEIICAMMEAGADYITTDNPEEAIRIKTELKK